MSRKIVVRDTIDWGLGYRTAVSSTVCGIKSALPMSHVGKDRFLTGQSHGGSIKCLRTARRKYRENHDDCARILDVLTPLLFLATLCSLYKPLELPRIQQAAGFYPAGPPAGSPS